LALSEALVTDESALLITNEATKGHTLEGPICEITVDLASRDETGQDGFLYAEKLQKDQIPLERTDIEQKRPGCVGHFADVLASAHATK
jgi:hypothetical protein